MDSLVSKIGAGIILLVVIGTILGFIFAIGNIVFHIAKIVLPILLVLGIGVVIYRMITGKK